jgi:hypothetical protein
LYKTTNTLTGKFYIGVHSTSNLDDGYIGSGKQIKDAIKKYGRDVFVREILEYFESREKAFIRESEIVTEDFIKNSNNYNMGIGGLGGNTKTEEIKRQVSKKLKGRVFTEEHSKKKSLAQTGEKNHRYGKSNPNNPVLYGKDNGMFEKTHSEATKKMISDNRKLAKVEHTQELIEALSLACKGKLWYNNGIICKRFKEGEQPEGFIKGRKIRESMGLK